MEKQQTDKMSNPVKDKKPIYSLGDFKIYRLNFLKYALANISDQIIYTSSKKECLGIISEIHSASNKDKLKSYEITYQNKDFEVRRIYKDIFALTFSDQDICKIGTEKGCLDEMPIAQKEFDDFISREKKNIEQEQNHVPSLKIDKSLCTDTEYMVLSSMVQEGSYRHDACFPYEKIIGSNEWKQSQAEEEWVKDMGEQLRNDLEETRFNNSLKNGFNGFDYLGVDVDPKGNIEILCRCESNKLRVTQFMTDLNQDLKKITGLENTIEGTYNKEGKLTGHKMVIHNSIMGNNSPLQKHIIDTLEKFGIDYSNSGIAHLNNIRETENRKSIQQNTNNRTESQKKSFKDFKIPEYIPTKGKGLSI